MIPLLLGVSMIFSFGTEASEVWLSGDVATQPDYSDVFTPNAPWQQAARIVRVYKTSMTVLLRASDYNVRQMIVDLQRRGIALGLEALMIPNPTPSVCGMNVEGYSAPGTMKLVSDRVKRLGGDIQYIAMDEPMHFGHQYSGKNSCHSEIRTIANAVAVNVMAVRSDFPDVKIGDIEVLGGNTPLQDVMQFATAYRTAVGAPLDFIHFDIDWNYVLWLTTLRSFEASVRKAGIKVGIIYNGGTAQSDISWTAQAERYIKQIEADRSMVPDQAIFQTWVNWPTHMLPETQPGTLTYLVRRYTASR